MAIIEFLIFLIKSISMQLLALSFIFNIGFAITIIKLKKIIKNKYQKI